LIKHILFRSARRFNIRVYQYAVAGNHVHLLVKAKSRLGMQNFFRVFAGHLAQEILRRCPVVKPPSRPLRVGQRSSSFVAGGASTSRGCRPACLKNQRRFWGYLVYSRVLTWGREYRLVKLYIIQNMLEALGVVAYVPRSTRASQKQTRTTQGRAGGALSGGCIRQAQTARSSSKARAGPSGMRV
ncbi:MAG: transposase, partial [Bdellovibrionaceae bacterium]|nr:transposase [Pseudobdellovibrionaceae bacterium]